MSFTNQRIIGDGLPDSISNLYLADEAALVERLCDLADPGESVRSNIHDMAAGLVAAVRLNSSKDGGIEAFLQQYDLASEEGVLLMCVAEALLRIPDGHTADRLIADKITAANWKEHLGESDSLFVNASTWGLMLTGQILNLDVTAEGSPAKYLGKIASRAGEPVIRAAMRQAMKIMGHQFVMGRTIDEALDRSEKKGNRAYRHSFDMLGEAALTSDDATRYFESYTSAIRAIGARVASGTSIFEVPSISVKLSALHPRYEFTHCERVIRELVPRVSELARLAMEQGIAMTVDTEESNRLELSLEVFKLCMQDSHLKTYDGLGIAIQTYLRRAMDVVEFVADIGKDLGRRIPVRLVKGAYWDAEIKQGQIQGLDSYPVFTRKAHSDVSYLACARVLLQKTNSVYPQFATHNAHTLASIMNFAGSDTEFEFQRLHGMGEDLYSEVIDPEKFGRPCRVYAPVGSHEDLLPYLVRRLLENGSNTSFVNRIVDESIDIDDIVSDPVEDVRAGGFAPHASISSPRNLFKPDRENSRGYNLPDRQVTRDLLKAMDSALTLPIAAAATVGGKASSGESMQSVNPARNEDVVGNCFQADADAVDAALDLAAKSLRRWDGTNVLDRANILRKAANLFEENAAELLALCVREAGKTIPDAIAELREATDFLRYYASQAEKHFGEPVVLPGPTGERNTHGLRARGIFVCISPWNFPLAIFTGQIAAALAAGNPVLAKPAEQTPLVAYRAFQLLLEAGVPADVLHFLPGDGASVGGYAVADPRVAGVAFTGSTETARLINRTLAAREGPIATFIAETGGQNAMFVDSSALPEQVVHDAAFSAFNSAGQRCSALRLLCVQEDIAPRVIELLKGYMQELSIGDPSLLSTDVGPVIDQEALALLQKHQDRMSREAQLIYRCELPAETRSGTFFAPVAIEIENTGVLEREVFGPVLHVLRYRRSKLADAIEKVNSMGYGLTMGLHSRIDSRANALAKHSCAGNIYINRNMVGAVVGVQPFGGRGLSGTGPKAGGPHYLPRFGSEYTVSNNTSAVGGNASLLSLDND